MESLEMLANNLSNASTGGYKTDREFYSLYVSEAAGTPDQGSPQDPDTLPIIERHWTDFSQGNLRQTGNPLNVALDGKGFLAVNGPSGTLYTRNGDLRVSSSGTLVTSDGYPLRSTEGSTIQVNSGGPIEVDTDGAVRQDGQDIGQLAIVDFDDPTAIDKRGLNYFVAADPNRRSTTSNARLHQGAIEESNVGPAEGAVRLVSVMRQFESLQKALTIGADMNKHAVEEVARVGS